MRAFARRSIVAAMAAGAWLAVAPPVFAQAPAVVDWLKADVARGRIPGAVVLIVRDGKVVLHEAVGFADRDKNIPMTVNSLHPIASSTKIITTVAALRLVEQNRLA